jgi:hypothetical protein
VYALEFDVLDGNLFLFLSKGPPQTKDLSKGTLTAAAASSCTHTKKKRKKSIGASE